MIIDLDKTDFIAMIKGRQPGYDIMNQPLVKNAGYYQGGFAERWVWQTEKLEAMPEKDLSTLYFLLKEFGF